MKTGVVFLVFSFSFLGIFGQFETSKWYFGKYAALDFMTDQPTVLTNSAMKSSGVFACTSMADENGDLLFYSKGDTVFNRFHQVMANGTGLLGKLSVFSIKKPGSYTIFYLLTIGSAGLGQSFGLRYSVIDMTLAAGNGSVITKNVPLYTDSCWGISATPHCNGSDIWIITHKRNSPEFRNYLLTSTGISATFVTSSLGTLHQYFQHIKVSPAGDRIMAVVYDPHVPTITNAQVGKFNLYDFNRSTGVVTNEVNFTYSVEAGYCEFSPDGSKLYGVVWDNNALVNNWLVQWNLCAGSATAIAASIYTVHTGGPFDKLVLQRGLNGKIYMSRLGQSFIGVVNNPNTSGSACNYVDNGQTVAPKLCEACLPQFMDNYIKFQPFGVSISQTMSCLTATLASSPMPTACSAAGFSVTSVSWLFGDPASGAANSSTLANPIHVFSGPGTYTVKEILYNTTCAPDTVRRVINVNGPVPILTITPGFSICTGQTVNLSVSGADTYTWNIAGPGVNNTSISVSPTITSTYNVIGTNSVSNCSEQKTVLVTVSKCTGISVIEASKKLIQIYPNPGSGIFHIESSISAEGEMYNLLGKKIKSIILKVGAGLLDLTMFDNGLYFLRISGQNEVFRIVKGD